jgi:F-type H+-transporting ATPase subunit b
MMSVDLWVLISFLIFFALLAYFGVHKTILGALDNRSTRIAQELDEARRLREEAQHVLAEYQRKRHEAEEEAQSIIQSARVEADRIAADARAKAEDFVSRRTRAAETKIAQAEAEAVNEVRSVAADAAVRAAEQVLRDQLRGGAADKVLADGLAEVRSKLH